MVTLTLKVPAAVGVTATEAGAGVQVAAVGAPVQVMVAVTGLIPVTLRLYVAVAPAVTVCEAIGSVLPEGNREGQYRSANGAVERDGL